MIEISADFTFSDRRASSVKKIITQKFPRLDFQQQFGVISHEFQWKIA